MTKTCDSKLYRWRIVAWSLLGALCALRGLPMAHAGVVYYHNDGLGSPVAASDETGTVIWREGYQAYGDRTRRELSAKPNSLWFTGKPHEDEMGLSYFGARWYDPKLQRFTGIDPVAFNEGNLQSFNPYTYANNSPYRFVDPNGQWAIDFDVILIGLSLGYDKGFFVKYRAGIVGAGLELDPKAGVPTSAATNRDGSYKPKKVTWETNNAVVGLTVGPAEWQPFQYDSDVDVEDTLPTIDTGYDEPKIRYTLEGKGASFDPTNLEFVWSDSKDKELEKKGRGTGKFGAKVSLEFNIEGGQTIQMPWE